MYVVFADHAKRFGVDAAVASFSELGPERVEAFRKQYLEDKAKIRSGGPPIITAGREDWYSGPDENSRYWRALAEELEGAQGWPEERLESLDRSSNVVVAHTPQPSRPARWDAKGLVVGYVQSGKTTNFTAVIAKLADEGYQMVVVLSGLHNGLRRQTQERLDQQLKELNPDRWTTLTSEDRDFGRQTAYLSALLSEDKIALAVVKKNKPVLTKLVRWLERPEGRRALQAAKVLVIDDEADQASVATTSINPLILRLLQLMPLCTYVGYTATPFANVFIDPTSEDLYPRDFILNLPRPAGYFGPEKLFGRDAVDGEDDDNAPDGYDMVRIVPASEVPLLRPTRQEAPSFIATETASLVDAVHWFWLATAARRARGDRDHSTMLVHTVVQTVVHAAYKPLLQGMRDRALKELADNTGTTRQRMREQWEDEADRVPAADWGRTQNTWSEVEAHLKDVIEATLVVMDNSASKERLNYSRGEDEEEADGVVAIAVGANTLSRGLTLQGLTSSLFVRTANAYDTLLQMGRWFGFRPGYEELPRLWTTAQLRDDFRHLASVEHEMRDDIDRYQRENLTPTQFAVRIQTHPALQITAKMGAAQRAFISYAGRRLQTRFFPVSDADWIADNIDTASRLIAASAQRSTPEPAGHDGRSTLFRDVPVDLVRAFLQRYRVHEKSPDLDRALLLAYIDRQTDAQPSSLQRWTVAVMGGGQAPVALGGLEFPTLVRARLNDENLDRADIKTLMSKEDRIVDLGGGLSPTEVRAIPEERLGDMRDDDPVHRDQGLLVLYPIEARSEPRPRPARPGERPPRPDRVALDAVDTVIGVGLVFPGRPDVRNRVRATHMAVSLVDVLPDIADDDVDDVLNRDTEDDPT